MYSFNTGLRNLERLDSQESDRHETNTIVALRNDSLSKSKNANNGHSK